MATTVVNAAATVAPPAAAAAADGSPLIPEHVFDNAPDDDLPQRGVTHDAPFWVGVAMGVTGLGIIIFAATQMFSANV